jgi:hypothetical protein
MRRQVLLVLALLLGVASANDSIAASTCTLDVHCLNGGTCQQDDAVQQCRCPDDYGGSRCEQHCPLQCANGGRCYELHPGRESTLESVAGDDTDVLGDFYCDCRGLFTGHLCDIPYANCGDLTRCFNGGACKHSSRQDPCDCPDGFGGRFCEIYSLWGGDDETADETVIKDIDSCTSGKSGGGKALLSILTVLTVSVAATLGFFVWRLRRQIDNDERKGSATTSRHYFTNVV